MKFQCSIEVSGKELANINNLLCASHRVVYVDMGLQCNVRNKTWHVLCTKYIVAIIITLTQEMKQYKFVWLNKEFKVPQSCSSYLMPRLRAFPWHHFESCQYRKQGETMSGLPVCYLLTPFLAYFPVIADNRIIRVWWVFGLCLAVPKLSPGI